MCIRVLLLELSAGLGIIMPRTYGNTNSKLCPSREMLVVPATFSVLDTLEQASVTTNLL